MGIGREVLRAIREKPSTEREIREKFNLTPMQLKEAFKTIESFGHELVYTDKHWGVSSSIKKQGKVIIVKDGDLTPMELYIADIHSGDRGCNHTFARETIDYAYKRGARYVFIAGDLVAGLDVYPPQIHDLRFITFDRQVRSVGEILPVKNGLEYFVINGNHDLNWMRHNAGNVAETLSEIRDDVHFVGDEFGRIIKNGIKIDMVHFRGKGGGSGGVNKITNYLTRKLKAQYLSRPDILIGGHLHEMLDLMLFGCQCVLPGHFQEPNSFCESQGLLGQQGAYLVDYKIDKRRVTHFRIEKLTT